MTTYGHGQNKGNSKNNSSQHRQSNNNGNRNNSNYHHSGYSNYNHGGNGGGGIGSNGGGGGGGRRPNRNNHNKHSDPSYNPYLNDMLEEEKEDKERENSRSRSRSSLNPNTPSFVNNNRDLAGIKEEKRRYTSNGLTLPSELGYPVLNQCIDKLLKAVDDQSINDIQRRLATANSIVQSMKNGNSIHLNSNSNYDLNNVNSQKTKPKQHISQQGGSKNAKKKRKRITRPMLSYDAIPNLSARDNFKIPKKFTTEKIPQIVHENNIEFYEYILQTIQLQQYDKSFVENGELCIVNLDLHLKDNPTESLYLVSEMIADTEKNRNKRWNTRAKLYTASEIKEKSICKSLPKSSRESKEFINIPSTKQKIEDSLTKVIEKNKNWNKLPVFNHHENKCRITMSITKEELKKKLKEVMEEKKENDNDNKLKLIPILMFNNTRQKKGKI